MLVLTGLPTLFPKLVDARTFAERMFHVMMLERLDEAATGDAITKPIKDSGAWVSIAQSFVPGICNVTRGYPYFIQFVCRELYDVWTQHAQAGEELRSVPWDGVMRKLDADFFAGRWASEFSVQDIVRRSAMLPKPFSGSHVNQMLAALAEAGLVCRNRWGKYSLAVPLLDQFIKRQMVSA